MREREDDDEEDIVNLAPLQKDRKARFVVWPSGYVLDREPFKAYYALAAILILIIVLNAAKTGEYYKAYAYCPPDAIGGFCSNPLYGKCDLPACLPEFLQPGETIGELPKSEFWPVVLLLLLPLALLFLFNHFQQNTRRFINARNLYKKQERERRRSDKTTPEGPEERELKE